MEFKTLSINRRRGSAFTLVEFMVASGLGAMIAGMLVAVTFHTSRSMYKLTDSVSINSQSRYAIDRMSQKLRQATKVTAFSPTSLTVTYNNHPLSYKLLNGTLVEVDDGAMTKLVKHCDSLKFSLYKRNPVTNSFNQFPILSATNEAKVVQVNWQCSTKFVGQQASQGEVYSAKIVLRAK